MQKAIVDAHGDMIVDGIFDTVTVVDGHSEQEWELENVTFSQDGFTFWCFLDRDAYPIIDTDYHIIGVIDEDVVAEGSVARVSQAQRDGEDKLRVVVTPPTYDAIDTTELPQ